MTLKSWKAWLRRDRTSEYESWKERNGIVSMPTADCHSEKEYDYHDEDLLSFDMMQSCYGISDRSV